MDRVLVPIDPVEPRIASFFTTTIFAEIQALSDVGDCSFVVSSEGISDQAV